MFCIDWIQIHGLFQYRDFLGKFSPGINILIGPNGSGKSNLINSIYFALTGELPYRKADCVNYHVDDSQAQVTMQFQIGEDSYLVKRTMKSHILRTPDAEIVGSGEIANYLQSRFGIDNNYLARCVFLRAGDMRNIVVCSAKERIEFFQRFLPLKILEQIWDRLGQFLNQGVAGEEPDFSAECQEYWRLDNQLKIIGPVRPSDAIRNEIEQLRIYEGLLREMDELLQEYENIRKRIAAIEEQIENAETHQFQEDPRLTYLVSNQRICRSLVDRYKTIKREWPSRPKRIRVDTQKMEKLKAERHFLEHREKQIDSFLQSLHSEPKCPLCGRECDPEQLRAHLKEESDYIRSRKYQINKALASYQQLLQQAEEALHRRRRLLDAIHNLRQELRNFQLSSSEIDEERLQQYAEKLKRYQDQTKAREQLKQSILILQGQQKSIKERIQRLQEQIDRKAPPSKTLSVLEDELAKAKQAEEIRTRMEMLEPYLERQERINQIRERKKIARIVRDIFHPNAVPRRLTKNFLAAITATTNNYLKLFHTNYLISLEDDGSCTIHYQTGAKLSERHLSFGEQLMLALAMYLGIGSLQQSIRLLVLDEPTLGLDDDHVHLIPAILQALTQAKTDLQIICATHEKKLLPCAATVIDLTNLTTSS